MEILLDADFINKHKIVIDESIEDKSLYVTERQELKINEATYKKLRKKLNGHFVDKLK